MFFSKVESLKSELLGTFLKIPSLTQTLAICYEEILGLCFAMKRMKSTHKINLRLGLSWPRKFYCIIYQDETEQWTFL